MSHVRKTIRNIDPDVLLQARVFALQHYMNIGEMITESLVFFMQEADLDEDQDSQSNNGNG